MKLHLPSGLRSAILACFAVVSGMTLPGSLAGGVALVACVCSASSARAEAVVWDANWGISGAPSDIPSANVIQDIPGGFTFLSKNGSPYTENGQTIVRLAGTASGVTDASIIGGAGATGSDPASGSEGPLTVDTWMKVSGGSYATLVGGSYAQNYLSGEPASFSGDSHILMTEEGGSAPSVDYIVGGNYMDAQNAAFTGNSYISVQGGTVNGSLVGGGTSAHIQTAVFNGDSRIWIYTPLSGTASSRFDLPGNLIVGGCASVANYAPKLRQTGDSQVTLDLSAYAPAQGAAVPAMEKIIIGDAWLSGGSVSTHTGSSSVVINGTLAQSGVNATFSLPVVAGSWLAGGGTASLSGDTALTVTGGSFSNALVGGVYMASDAATVSATVGGSSTVTLGGAIDMSGSAAMVVGGSYVNAANATLQSGALAVTITDGSYAGNVIGGSFIAGGSGTVSQETGNISLTISGGTVSGTLYGGSYTARDNADSLNQHGAISISLEGGSILGDVYAGGGVVAGVSSGITAESTQVELSDSVVLGSAATPVMISGGVQNSDSASSIAGDRTLLLSSSNAYANLDNAVFSNFNIVNNAADATIKLQEIDSSFTKKGAGALSINGAGSNLNSIAELTVEQGSLNTGTAWLTRSNQGLTSITIGSGTSLTTDGLVLADGASLSLDVTGASSPLITVGIAGGLSIGGQKTLELTLSGVNTLASGSSATLLSWGNTEAASPIVLDNVTWTNKGAEQAAYELAIVGKTLVLNHVESLVWDGSATGTWNASSGNWEGQSSVASNGKAVVFNTPTGASSTVTISGDVSPQSISVNNAEGTTYSFEADAAGGAITGETTLAKTGGGILSLQLANTYTGGTTVADGTVDAAVAGALGTGAVTLDGGELLASAENAIASNAVVFHSGTLRYTANETRSLDSASISHAAGAVPVVSVAAGTEVTWQYSDAAALQNALGGGISLNGGGSLNADATSSMVEAALSGSITLEGEGTTLEFTSPGSRQLGSAAAPMAISLGAGTYLRVERPQSAVPTTIDATLEGSGTLEFASSDASATGTVQLGGDASAFAGNINLGSVDAAPAADTSSPALLLDYSAGSPVGGENATLNLNGLSFATMLLTGSETTTAAAVRLNRSTTQYAQTAGLANTFTGAVTGEAGSAWMLDATPVTGGQTNTLAGELSGFSGTLETRGQAGSVSRWVLGGEGAVENSMLSVSLSAADAFNEFVIDYAGETTLSGAVTGLANLTQQGAGTLVLTGDNDSSGTLTVASGGTVQLGSATDAGQWGNASGSTLAGAGEFHLVNGSLVGPLAVASGAGVQVLVNVAAGCSVDMGGNEGSLLAGPVTVASGGTLTNVGSSILDRELNFTLAEANVGNGTAAATAIVQFVDSPARAVTASLGSTTEAINLDASAADVVELLRQHRVEGTESYLTLTNGQLITAADYSNVLFGVNTGILDTLGLRIDRVDGGSLVLSGAARGVYIAGEGEDPTEASGYQNFGAYQAVAVMPGETLTLSLDGAPDATQDGAGATINNLLGAEDSALVINNTDAAGGSAVVILNNSAQDIDPVPGGLPGDPKGADTTFGGSISQQGGNVELVKTGAGTLRVGGNVTAHQLTLQEGTVSLNGSEHEFDILSADGGSIALARGTTSVSTLEDTAKGGLISIAEGADLLSTGTGNLSDTRIEGSGSLQVEGSLSLAEDARLAGVALDIDGGTLVLDGTAGHRVSALSGDGSLSGVGTVDSVGISVTGTGGRFAGSLAGNGTLTVAEGATQDFGPGFTGGSGWNLTNHGTMSLDLVKANGGNAPLELDALTLAPNSVTGLNLNTDAPMAKALTLGSISVGQGAVLNLSAAGAENILRGDMRYVIGTVSDGQPAGTLATITPDLSDIVFMLVDADRSTLMVDGNGNLVLNLSASNTNKLEGLADNPNSAAGASQLWNAALAGNTAPGTDIRRVLEALYTGSAGVDANRLLAAVSGASATVLGSAFASDVERQLRAIRNRTTAMEGKPRIGCKGRLATTAPQFSAWVNGEGDHRKLDAGGYLPGYTLTSWGGTLGMDISGSEAFIGGLAITAMYGELKAHSADAAEGDFDRYYLTAYARLQDNRWCHTLLGTVGRLEADVDRTVFYGNGSYRTHADTNGWGYGFMYEIGYSIPMNEDSTFILQPVANVAWRHVNVDGYTESGSDAGLRVSSQSYNIATFGAGLRAQSQVGEELFNRCALLEGRALVKVDAGDREGEAMVSMLGGGGRWDKVRSEKLGAVGVELGAGITIPLADDDGAFFIDGSAELRNSWSNLNGTLGYRIKF